MRAQLSILIALALAGGCQPVPTELTTAGGQTAAVPGTPHLFEFDDAAGGLPTTMTNVLGQWSREADASSPSGPNVLYQRGEYGAADFPRAMVNELTFTDATVSVRCRPEAGHIDQACGLMFRAHDSDNYYLTRANAIEGNVRLYRVVDGSRMQLASANREVARNAWQALQANTAGDEIIVSWNGEEVIRVHDASYAKGKIGVWTKADSVTAFDDLLAIEQ